MRAKLIFQGFRHLSRRESPLARLILLNAALYLLLALVQAGGGIAGERDVGQSLLQFLGVPASLDRLARAPWTLVTYMFTHAGFLHLLFNILWLYWFGSIFRAHLPGRSITPLYLLGGASGALLYLAVAPWLPGFAGEHARPLIGASGAVMAIVFATCVYRPGHQVYILLVGRVKLLYLALFTVIVDLASIPGDNAGGHVAHLGGALVGCIFAVAARQGIWLTAPVDRLTGKKRRARKHDSHASYRKKVHEMTDHEYNMERARRNERVNKILDKISRSGYDSLSREEREILFKSGR